MPAIEMQNALGPKKEPSRKNGKALGIYEQVLFNLTG